MTVAQLKKELEDRGLDASGLKAALVARYEEALVGSGGSAPAADPATTAAPAKDDDEVSMDAGDDLEDAPVSDGEDEPSAKKPKADPAQPVSSQNPS